jgi:hypothetical protein
MGREGSVARGTARHRRGKREQGVGDHTGGGGGHGHGGSIGRGSRGLGRSGRLVGFR